MVIRGAAKFCEAAIRHQARFSRDESGVTMIEFGLLAVPFLLILMGIFMNSYVLFSQSALDYTVYSAARLVMTGQTQNNAAITDATSFIKQTMCGSSSNLPSYMDCTKLQIDLRVLPNFASSNPGAIFAPGGTKMFCPGVGSSYVMLSASYPLPTLFPLLTEWISPGGMSIGASTTGMTLDANGNYIRTLESTIVLRNEPFTTTSTLPGC